LCLSVELCFQRVDGEFLAQVTKDLVALFRGALTQQPFDLLGRAQLSASDLGRPAPRGRKDITSARLTSVCPPMTMALNRPFRTGLDDQHPVNSLEPSKPIPDASVNAVVTSPPYALHFKKEYGNAAKHDYVEWFLPFAAQIHRVLAEDGSFVLNIGGSYNEGIPTRSLYHFKLLIALVERTGFHLAQECFWFNPAKVPMPAEWVTVRRIRVKDAVEYVWWLSKTPWPKADNRTVLRPYSKDMERLNQRGIRPTTRPSGHNIKPTFNKLEPGGSIPPNVAEEELPTDLLKFGNNAANDLYTERCKEAG